MEKETGYLIMARKMAYCYLFLFNSLFLESVKYFV